ncbi:MAG: hypothetical protein ACI9MR_002409 [Myxococcota bacterium]|jgi:hypothetical protein
MESLMDSYKKPRVTVRASLSVFMAGVSVLSISACASAAVVDRGTSANATAAVTIKAEGGAHEATQVACPTMGVASKPIPTGQVWSSDTTVAAPSIHFCMVVDANGLVEHPAYIKGQVVRPGECASAEFFVGHGNWYEMRLNRVDCATRESLDGNSEDSYEVFFSADGSRRATFLAEDHTDEVLLHGGTGPIKTYALVVDSPTGTERFQLARYWGAKYDLDQAAIAASNRLLTRGRFARSADRVDDDAESVVAIDGGTVRVSHNGRTASAAIPVGYAATKANSTCCDAGEYATIVRGGEYAFIDLSATCDGCDDVASSDHTLVVRLQ